jgi:ribosomal-protein-alanine N-acetyltransferase
MVELRTARLLLRRFRASDVDDSRAYRDDREFARFLPHIPQPFTQRDAEEFVTVNMTDPWDTLPTFAVVRDDHVIGTVNFTIDLPKRTAMIGYALARAHWGVGLATEAATAAIAWAAREHQLDEVWASTSADNIRSRRVMAKLGMTFESELDGEVRYRVRLTAGS